MNKQIVTVACALLFVAAIGCGGSQEPANEAEVQSEPVRRATAYLTGRSGGDLGGSAIFINDGQKVELQVTLEDAPPGEHAVHIHEFGDCSADDGSSAGGHWNPTGEDHGHWEQAPFHLGDIGNVVVGEDGKGSLSLTTDRWTMGDGGPHDIMGLAVIVHADPDDFTSQPSGAAGARIGCGVIKSR